MRHDGGGRRLACVIVGVAFLVGACTGRESGTDAGDSEVNAYPKNYKPEILAAMHAYLNDPTGVRDAAISEPMLRPVARSTHYVVCLRFSAKRSGGSHAGAKELAALFIAGRFDQFVEAAREPCAGATYGPFPELEKMTR